MKVISNPATAPMNTEVTVVLTGLEVLLVYEALSMTGETTFNRIARTIDGVTLEFVRSTDGSMFTAFDNLATVLGIAK
jgi:hypothetical protein